MVDALGTVLHTLRFEAQALTTRSSVAGSVQTFSAFHAAFFHVVEQGEYWLTLPERNTPVRLLKGDMAVISNLQTYKITAENHPTELSTLITGYFRPEYGTLYPVFLLLPPLILVPAKDDQRAEWLTTSLHFLRAESEGERPASEAVISRLLDILFIMIARYWIENHTVTGNDWLHALYDPQIGQVLELLHREPEQEWSVEMLARRVNMSRSALAGQFTQRVGESPMKYLLRWRMQITANLLTDSRNLTFDEIAHSVGYSSASALSKAFKRLMGVTLSEHRERYRERLGEARQ